MSQIASEEPAGGAAPAAAPAGAEQASDVAPFVLDAASAQLVGWCGLALLNQGLIEVVLSHASLRVHLLHHAYDAAQLVVLGVLSLVSIRLAALAAARAGLGVRRGVVALSLSAIVFVVGLLTLGDDVANVAERLALKPWLVRFAASLVFALLLGASALLRPLARGVWRWLFAAVGLSLAASNAFLLEADYFGLHLMLAWLGALSLGYAVEGLALPGFGRRVRRLVLGALALGALLGLVFPPQGEVLRRLHGVQSSVLAPLLADLMPELGRPGRERVAAEYLSSPWFRDRSQLPAIPASRAIQLPEPAIVMFFTVDAFRADVLESQENLALLPELNKLREASAYFQEARSPTPSTMTTLASVFSGKYYASLHWNPDPEADEVLIEELPAFPELLARAGVRTVLIAGTLGRLNGPSGVAPGFATEVTLPKTKKGAKLIVDAIIRELEQPRSAPLFIYGHFIEPHAPYDLAGKKGSQRQRYVREIAIVDRELGRLRAYLEQRGLSGKTALIVSADHGEGFGEHGTFNHARTVYEELVRVPLFVHVPGAAPRLIATPASLMDVGPTVLDLFGLPTPPTFMGESLLPIVAGQPAALSRPIIVDAGRRIQAFCFPNGNKVILDLRKHTVEVYDLKADPRELVNLADSDDPQIVGAIATAKLFFDVHELRVAGYKPPWVKF